jgi:hypothetical protein
MSALIRVLSAARPFWARPFLRKAWRDKRCGNRERQTRNQRQSIISCHEQLAAAF